MWVSADSFGVDVEELVASPGLQCTTADLERRTPDPCRGVAHGGTPAQELRVRLCDRIARDLSITGEGIDRAP